MTQLKATPGAAPEGESPLVAAALRPGDVVLELGSGLGFDSFLAARQVGLAGDVIGVDPSPDRVARARANARMVAALNVTFLLGELEQLPVADGSVDVVVSNQASMPPASQGSIREAFRVLRDGGRLAIRIGVDGGPVPASLTGEDPVLASYLTRTLRLEEMRAMLRAAGFDPVTFHGAAEHAKTAVAVKAGEGGHGSRPECCS